MGQWSAKDVLQGFYGGHGQIMALAESLSEEELFTPGRYAWAKTNALASYIVSCTSSHYRWARTEMRKGSQPQRYPGNWRREKLVDNRIRML